MADLVRALRENASNHLGAITLCLTHRHHMPALALVYCGIDIFAAMSRPASQEEATRHDFTKWCDRYLLPGKPLECTAVDLYGARCSVLHTYTSKSALSRSGKARQIVYAWGRNSAADLQAMVDATKFKGTHVAVHIETLATAFEHAVNTYLTEALSDPEQLPVLQARHRELFINRN